MKKIIIINSIIIIILLCILDVFFYYKQSDIEEFDIKEYKFFNSPVDFKYEHNKDMNAGMNFIGEKSPLFIIGCSFAYSYGLNYEDSFAYKLANYTQRPVYVFALPSTGPNETLKIFSDKKLFEGIPEPEYIIYLFIENHFSRINSRIYSLISPQIRPFYKIDKNYDFKEKPCLNRYLFLSHIYKYYYLNRYTYNYGVREEKKFFNIMMALKKQINKYWKSTKLVIIRYDEANIDEPFLFDKSFIEDIENNGIIYYDADELVFGKTGERMIGDIYMQEDQHPSAYAMQLLSEKLAEKLN